jgi:hypothetical protein
MFTGICLQGGVRLSFQRPAGWRVAPCGSTRSAGTVLESQRDEPGVARLSAAATSSRRSARFARAEIERDAAKSW